MRARRKRKTKFSRFRETYVHISTLQFTDAGVKIQADAISIWEL